MCTLFMNIYKHFIHFLLILYVGICFLPVFLSLLFYREDIDILYTFQVVLRVYFTDIVCTFYRHYIKPFFCVDFIEIFCSSFGGHFMKISRTFYPTYFTEFFLEYFTRIMFTIKKVFRVRCKVSVNFWLGFHGHFMRSGHIKRGQTTDIL